MAAPSRVISIFSTKGGVGKTTLATNLAAALQVHHRTKTAFLELSGSDDDSARMLGSTHVHRVTQPVTVESVPTILADLRSTYPCVFIDAGSLLTDLSITAFEHSHLILLVATPDLIAIRHTNETIRLLGQLNIPPRMIKVVLNRAESRGNFRSSDVKQQLQAEVIAEIPSDGRTVSTSVNRGVPFVVSAPGTRIADVCDALAAFFLQRPEIFVEQFTLDRSRASSFVGDRSSRPGTPEDLEEGAQAQDPIVALKQRIHSKLVEELDLKRLDMTALNVPRKAQELKRRVEQAVLDLLVREQGFIADPQARARFVKEIVDEILGMGPLEDLMADPEVSDILVNGAEMIYVERRGQLYPTERRFTSDRHLYALIERIIAPLGRRIDESTPMVDARLPDGSRVNAIIPPLSLKGPMLSIRKFSRERYTIGDLVRFGTLNEAMAEFLRACIVGRKNLVVSGGTGSGKTTVLNVLSSFISDTERIITIEDAAELKLAQRHWAALEARPPNIEGRGQITIRQLFRNTLRMRPDRIIIGECRGDETLDMLQAMNTGHDGSLTTLHANSPQDVVARLDSLVLMSNVDLPVRAIREQIASAVHLIVHTARLADGSRKITHIAELTGMDERGNILLQDMFRFDQSGVDAQGRVMGAFQATGYRPSFLQEFRTKGLTLPDDLFTQK